MPFKREDVNPNTEDTKYNLTPLGVASQNGHTEVVKQLFERVDINHNTIDEYGRTPHILAVRRG